MDILGNGYLTITSIMAAMFALHLALKRDQMARLRRRQMIREKCSLEELKKELEINLTLCNRLRECALVDLQYHDNFKTEVIRKYIGDFPLTRDELSQIEGVYDCLNRMNEELDAKHYLNDESRFRRSLVPMAEDGKPQVESALVVVEKALKEF